MRNGSSALLVDTNVLVSAYDPTEGAKRERAITVLECLGARQMGALSAQILGEFFVTVTRKIPSPLTEAEAERSVMHDVRSWVVYDLTEQVVLEDFSDGALLEGVRFLNPFADNVDLAWLQTHR